MKKHKLKMYESQVQTLREMLEAQDTFMNEAAGLCKMMQEGQNDLMNEGLVDSFQKLMTSGGFNAVKRAVQAAVVAGTLMGVSDSAMAQAAQKVGATPQQATELATMVKSGGSLGNTAGPEAQKFTQDLAKLNNRFVIADGSSQKDFMKFTGDIADVVGIEPKNGYPIFAKGSDSEARLKAAFTNPKVINGTVDVRGQVFKGQFVKNDGLYYTYTQGVVQNGSNAQAPDPIKDGGQGQVQAGASTNGQNQEMIDFTGLFQQAQIRYKQYAKPDGTITDGGKTFTDFKSYIPEFLRKSDKGFANMSDSDIAKMFANGLKARVEKGAFTMGGVSRPNMIRR